MKTTAALTLLGVVLVCGVQGQYGGLNNTVTSLHDATRLYVGAVTQNKAIPAILRGTFEGCFQEVLGVVCLLNSTCILLKNKALNTTHII